MQSNQIPPCRSPSVPSISSRKPAKIHRPPPARAMTPITRSVSISAPPLLWCLSGPRTLHAALPTRIAYLCRAYKYRQSCSSITSQGRSELAPALTGYSGRPTATSGKLTRFGPGPVTSIMLLLLSFGDNAAAARSKLAAAFSLVSVIAFRSRRYG